MGKDSQSLLNLKGCVPAPGMQVILLISHTSSWEQQPLLPDLMPFIQFLSWNQLEIDFETEARGCISFPHGGVTACLLSARLGYFCSLLYVCVPLALFTETGRKNPIFPKSGWWGEEMTDDVT